MHDDYKNALSPKRWEQDSRLGFYRTSNQGFGAKIEIRLGLGTQKLAGDKDRKTGTEK